MMPVDSGDSTRIEYDSSNAKPAHPLLSFDLRFDFCEYYLCSIVNIPIPPATPSHPPQHTNDPAGLSDHVMS